MDGSKATRASERRHRFSKIAFKIISKLSESRICAKLILNKPYREFSAATLQKQLQCARRLVRDVISSASQESVREEAQRRGVALTAEFEEKLLKQTRSAVARRLSGLSSRGRKPKDFAI